MKKKVLILIPTLGAGGAEKVLLNILNLIDKEKYEIDLVLARKSGELLKEVPSHINLSYLFKDKIVDRLTTFLYIFLGQNLLMKVAGRKIKGNYDVGISFLDSVYSDFLFFSKATFRRKVAVIHSSYLSYSEKANYRSGKHLTRMKMRYSKMDTLITVSHESMNEFKSLFGIFSDMRVIYNPINIDSMLNKANNIDSVELDESYINVIAVGRLIPVKGYTRLIHACKKLVDKGLSFKLTILGSGSQKDELIKQISELGLNKVVIIKGFVSNPYSWIKKADIFVMTSVAEGLPTSLCEALVLGKPVLTTNVPGCREVINYGEYGVMVEEDVNDIASGLEQLVLNNEMRELYAEKALQRAKIFDDQLAISKYYEVFD